LRAFSPAAADTIGQVKVIGPFHAEGWGESETEIADWCLVQCAWELHVAGKDTEHVGALLWPSVRTYTVRRDPELEGILVESVDKWWKDHIVANRPPKVDGSAGAARMLKAIYRRETGPIVQANPATEGLAFAYFEAKRAKAAAEGRFDLCQQRLQEACASFAGIDGDGWRLRYETRKAYRVEPDPYTVPAHRHWDIRTIKPKR
jgi:hypothetical protein